MKGPTFSGPRVIVALDFPTVAEALALASRLSPRECRLKVGFELFTSAGPTLVESLVEKGFDVFLDLKFHDIPTTVERACAAATRLGVWMLNVHTLGGADMLEAARSAIDKSKHRPLLIGVTLLTSHSTKDLLAMGLEAEPLTHVMRLAHMAKQARLDGVVSSAQEAGLLRATFGSGFCLVTPGIRLAPDIGHDDQQRVLSPVEAVRAGADYLVIGRPITRAVDPLGALVEINGQLKEESSASISQT